MVYKKQLYSILFVVIILVLGTSLYQTSDEDSNQETSRPSPRPISIGFIAPLSGTFSEFGQHIQNAVELALEKTVNDITVIHEDEATCDTSKALSAAEKLFTLNNARLVIGPACASNIEALMPRAEHYNALLFSTGLLGDDIFPRTHSIINLATQISTESQQMALYLKQEGYSRIAMIRTTDAFGEEYGQRLPEQLNKLGIDVVFHEALPAETGDYRTVITQLLTHNPDAIWLNQGQAEMGLFARQLREFGSDTPITSLYTIESESTVIVGESAIEGIRYTYPLGTADISENKKVFENEYQKRFASSPNPSAYYAYDGILLIDKALSVCTNQDTGCIKRFLTTYGEYHGVSGKMKIEKDGSNTRPFGIKEIRNGKFEWVIK